MNQAYNFLKKRITITLSLLITITAILFGSIYIPNLNIVENEKPSPAWSGETLELENQLFGEKSRRSISSDQQAGGPVCLKDKLYFRGSIEAEIEDYEKGFSATGITLSKTWNGINITKFKLPEVTYLSKFGDWILKSSTDYSGCNSLQCIINRSVDLTDEALYGKYVYLFFLKTGYAISTSRTSPKYWWDQSGNYVSSGVYFTTAPFSLEEIGNFWRLAYVLPDGMKYMTSELKALHRMPEGQDVYGHGSDVCGIATSDGHIISTHECILSDYYGSSWNMKLYNKHFWNHYLHEIAHRFDDNNGSLSEKNPWKGFSGWQWQAGTIVNGVKTKETWISDPKAEGFVTDYASTLPWEDFAESVESFRITLKEFFQDTQTLQTLLMPQKWTYISNTVFGGRTFTSEGIKKYYSDFISAKVITQIDPIIDACFINVSVDQIDQCVAKERDKMISAAIAELKGSEIDACDFLASVQSNKTLEVLTTEESLQKINPIVEEHIKERMENAEIFETVGELRLKLSIDVDPREAYIACFDAADPIKCFSESMTLTYDRIAEEYSSIPSDWLEREKDYWLKDNRYDDVRAKTIAFYSTIFASVNVLAEVSAKDLWKKCEVSELAADARVLLTPFDGGAHYVNGGFLNCVNQGYESLVDDVISKYLSRLGLALNGQKHRALVEKQIIAPTVKTLFVVFMEKELKLEQQALAPIKESISKVGEEAIAQNSDWIVIPWNKEASMVKCLDVGYTPAKSALDSMNVNILWKYHSKEGWIKDTIASFCEKNIAKQAASAASDKSKLDSAEQSIKAKIKKVLTSTSDWIVKPWDKEASSLKCLEKASKEYDTQLKSGLYPTLKYYPLEIVLSGLPQQISDQVIVESDQAAKLEKEKLDKNRIQVEQKLVKAMTSDTLWLVNPWNEEEAMKKCLGAISSKLATELSSSVYKPYRYYDLKDTCEPLKEQICSANVKASSAQADLETLKMNDTTKPAFVGKMEPYLIRYKTSWWVVTSGAFDKLKSIEKCIYKGNINIDYHMKALSSSQKISWKYNQYSTTTKQWVNEICEKLTIVE